MKARVDQELCVGCGLCETTCLEVFKMEGDKAVAISGAVPKDVEQKVKQAKDECPVEAIIVK